MKAVRIHEDAQREANQTTAWYVERNASAARRFRDELLSGFTHAAAHPLRFPSYLHGTRRVLLKTFPYFIVFFDWQDVVYEVSSGGRVTGSHESEGAGRSEPYMSKQSKRIPELASEVEEHAFWDSHKSDRNEYVNWSNAKLLTFPILPQYRGGNCR